jgi:large subunit ribosomal protein L22
MEVRAKVSHLPISARKLRLVCDQVRGMDAEEALTVLKFMPQKGAYFLQKLVNSALSNAEENFELSRQDLYIHTLFANEGPRQQRYKAGARGRYKPRVKPSSHVSIVLREYED